MLTQRKINIFTTGIQFARWGAEDLGMVRALLSESALERALPQAGASDSLEPSDHRDGAAGPTRRARLEAGRQ
jgi:hypothetical protein